MKKMYCFGYYIPNMKNIMYYCYDTKKGAYLSDCINNAHKYNDLEMAKNDMFKIMKYFFKDPVCCSIFKGTKLF